QHDFQTFMHHVSSPFYFMFFLLRNIQKPTPMTINTPIITSTIHMVFEALSSEEVALAAVFASFSLSLVNASLSSPVSFSILSSPPSVFAFSSARSSEGAVSNHQHQTLPVPCASYHIS